MPKTNTEYWTVKIARNKARDVATAKSLSDLEWRSLTIWECELKNLTAVSIRLTDFLTPPP